MAEEPSFADLLERVRAGDQDAAAQVVRRFEPELRRMIRVRLTDPRLRRVLDTADVCQSVLANFFIRVRVGEFDLEQPDDLLHLLLAMARNKVFDKARRQQARRRDQRRLEPHASAALDGVADGRPGPSSVIAWQDLLERVRALLDEDERVLAEKRAQGKEWPQIAAELGARPDALRKKLTRALDRVIAQLGLEVIDD